MAKRGSDHQLTRDDEASDGDEEVQVGMTKADPSVLASRPMKGLPKRKGATPLSNSGASSNASSAAPSPRLPAFGGFGSTPPAPTAETKTDATRFGGFTGFGAPTASTAPPAPPKPAEPTRFAAFTGFGSAPAPKTDAPAEAKPAEPPKFTGFTGFTGFGSAKPTATAQPTPEPAQQPKEDAPSDSTAALTYWTSLRGLNHAFMESAKRAVETDMFCDIGELFGQYNEHREKVVKQFEEAKRSKTSAPAPKPTAAPAPEPPKPAEAAKPSFSFGSSTIKDTASSPFSFGSKPPSTSAPKSSPFGLSLPTGKPVFGPSDPSLITPAATPPTIPPSPKKPAPTFGATAVPEPTPTPSPLPEGKITNIFDISAVKNTAPPSPPKPTFTFGSSTPSANPFAKVDAKPFSFNTSNSAAPAPSPALSTTATSGSSVAPSSKPFSFSTPLSTPGTPFAFGAGSPKGGATPKPGGGSVGFSFGNSPPRKETASAGFPFGSIPASTGSGASSAAQTPKGEHGSDEEKPKETEGEGGDSAAAEPDEDKSQAEGAGEENEDTLYAARARVLRFYKQAWVGVGIGSFKIKYDRETKKRRVLHRLEGTGRLVLNVRMFEQMDPVKETKAVLRFTGTDDQGQLMLYRVKVKTEDEADALFKSFTDALEAVKSEA
ncbi:Ran-specific GTPase-activating protein 1 [Ceratobasidium sp. AG-Ba]|nr:Ran-specific GTPase-activating protein 1 [Ceratobasidium sp. AG-Ba]